MSSFTSLQQSIGRMPKLQRIVLRVLPVWLSFLLAIPSIALGQYPPLPVPPQLAGPSGEPGQIMLDGIVKKVTLFHGSVDDEADWHVHIDVGRSARQKIHDLLWDRKYFFIGNDECKKAEECNLHSIYSELMVCDRHKNMPLDEYFYSADFTLALLLSQPTPDRRPPLARFPNGTIIPAPDWTGEHPAWDLGLIAIHSQGGKAHDFSADSQLDGGRVNLQGAFVEDAEHRTCSPPFDINSGASGIQGCPSAPLKFVKKTLMEIHPLDSMAFAMNEVGSILMSRAGDVVVNPLAPPQLLWPTNYVKWRVAVFANSNFHRINGESYMKKERTTTWYLDLPSDAYKGDAGFTVNVQEQPQRLWDGFNKIWYFERGVKSYEPWTIAVDPKDGRRKIKITVTMKVPDKWGGIVVRDYEIRVTPVPRGENYLVGDWDGDGKDNIAVRRSNQIFMDTNFDGSHDKEQAYGNGATEDQYLVGDWDGDGKDNIAVRRGNTILMDFNFDGLADLTQDYGNGNSEDQYLVGDWDGDGKDNIAVRKGNRILMDFNFDGLADRTQFYGNGNSETEYLSGDWDGDGKDNVAVRRGNRIFMDFNFDGLADKEQSYGNGDAESQYLVGDWDGDGKSNIAVRRRNEILMDINFDGTADKTQIYGNLTPPQ